MASTDVVIFSQDEIIEPDDLTAIGAGARVGLDAVTGGAIGYPAHWARFTVSNTAPLEVIVSAGALFADDKIYRNDAPETLNIQQYLPIITGDRKILAIIADGDEATLTEQRLFETDAETEETVAQQAPKFDRRQVAFTIAFGAASPTPLKPEVPANRCCIAWVELSTTGIAAIEQNQPSRVKTLYEHEGRLALVEGDLSDTRLAVSSIKTDIANIQMRLGDIPSPAIMRQIKRSVGQLMVAAKVPPEAVAYWYDPCLVADDWDTENPSWLARIREGLRFQFAGQRDAQLALVASDSPSIRLSGNLLLPAWTEETRLEVLGDGGSVNISGAVHTVIDAVLKTASRIDTEYGPTITACENSADWVRYIAGLDVGSLFFRDGEEYQVTAVVGNAWWTGHRILAFRQLIKRSVDYTYWDFVTSTVGLNGSIYGQTFLNTQPFVLTSIEVRFTAVGASGPVHLLLVECLDNGAPNFTAAIAAVEKQPEDLVVGWNRFVLTPTLLDGGKRYAWVTVTTGNHALETVDGNSYAQGSRFVCSDGVWAQASVTSDFAFRLNGAKFSTTRTTVEFQPLTLDNGICELRILHAGWEPAATSLVWEYKNPSLPNAQWRPITVDNADGAADLMGLPALVQLRAVFQGTVNLQPAIVLDATARAITSRPRGDFVAVSKNKSFGVSTTTVQTETVIDHYVAEKHTISPKLVVGSTVYTPSVTTVADEASAIGVRRKITCTFPVPSTTSARYRCDMASTEVTDLPFVQNAFMTAL
ncbi:MAG TPA: hypothetical protein VIF61_00405 [Methylocystis sp.]|jgi:hypothetical protein